MGHQELTPAEWRRQVIARAREVVRAQFKIRLESDPAQVAQGHGDRDQAIFELWHLFGTEPDGADEAPERSSE